MFYKQQLYFLFLLFIAVLSFLFFCFFNIFHPWLVEPTDVAPRDTKTNYIFKNESTVKNKDAFIH